MAYERGVYQLPEQRGPMPSFQTVDSTRAVFNENELENDRENELSTAKKQKLNPNFRVNPAMLLDNGLQSRDIVSINTSENNFPIQTQKFTRIQEVVDEENEAKEFYQRRYKVKELEYEYISAKISRRRWAFFNILLLLVIGGLVAAFLLI